MELNIGDKIYQVNDGKIQHIYNVDKVTKYLAYSGLFQFNRNAFRGRVTPVGKIQKWDFSVYYLENKKLN